MSLRRLLPIAWRESRFARRRLFLFLSAISLGVASLVAVQGFGANLARGIRAEARGLLGADLVLSSRQGFGSRTEALLDSLDSAGVEVARRTSFMSMALLRRTGGTRLVQVRAPQPGYPFYGSIRTRPERAWGELHEGRNVLVDPALLAVIGGRPGDSLSLGERRFRITGVLDRVPGDLEIVSAFAPRIFISASYVEETGLTEFGSRLEEDAFLAMREPGAPERLVEEYGTLLREERVRARTVAEEQAGLEEAFGRLSSFLSLVGVLALLLGGIGVASSMAAYMAEKGDTIAVFRCLGATAGQVMAVYLAQAAVMGAAGAVLGAAMGIGVQWLLPWLFTGLLPIPVDVRIEWPAALTGVVTGISAAVLFAALPLLAVRRVPPLRALRRTVQPIAERRLDVTRSAAWGVLLSSAFFLVLLQVRDAALTAAVGTGILTALALLWLLSWMLTRALRRLPLRGAAYVVRQGVANLHRPANQTRTVVMALGFGVFLMATLILTQHNLLLPLRGGDPAERPNLVLWDVQDDQDSELRRILEDRGAPVLQSAPIVSMRILGIGGGEGGSPSASEGTRERAGGPPEDWALRREYRSTYRDTLFRSERLASRRLWDPRMPVDRQVSLERGIAGDLGVDVGDTIVWDVQGLPVPTVVTSLREVDWARFEPNFFAVFPAEALEAAPRSWILLARAPAVEQRAEIQRRVVERFPNVSAIDLTLVQQALDEVVGRISAVIRFVGAFSVATGFVVLLGSVAAGRLQRIRESVLLKTLGATRVQIRWILVIEYLLLGGLAVVAGLALAAGAGWILARWVFDVPFELSPVPLAVLAILVTGLAVGVGVLASREVFRRTPLESIREG